MHIQKLFLFLDLHFEFISAVALILIFTTLVCTEISTLCSYGHTKLK